MDKERMKNGVFLGKTTLSRILAMSGNSPKRATILPEDN
jgi:hypothetical protein